MGSASSHDAPESVTKPKKKLPTVQVPQPFFDGKIKKVTAPIVQNRQLLEKTKTYITTCPEDLAVVTKSVTSQQPEAIVAQQSPVNFQLDSSQNTTDFNKNQPTTHPLSNTVENENEDDLICVVCREMFIEPMTLSCSHTFCKYCISIMRRRKRCPMCNVKFAKGYPTRALNNHIEKILENASEEEKEHRRQVIAERQAATVTHTKKKN